MLYLVQVVLSGSAEPPQVFTANIPAQLAFVDCAKKYWAQSYQAYCERTGVDSNSYESARGFVAAFDLAERSRIHFWTVTPEDMAPCGAPGPDLSALKGQRDRIAQLAQALDQASVAVRQGVTDVLSELGVLTGDGAGTVAPVVEPAAPRCLVAGDVVSPPPEALPQQNPGGTYDTKEWKEYVNLIKNMCGGNRSEYHLLTRQEWRQAVYHDQTSLEYWDWVAASLDHYIVLAQQAGYSVIPDPDQPGNYRFVTPAGDVSDHATEAEGEAWCRAGMLLDGRGGLSDSVTSHGG